MRRLSFPTAAVLVVLIGIADPTLGVVPAAASLRQTGLSAQAPPPVQAGEPTTTVPVLMPETVPGSSSPTVPPTGPGIQPAPIQPAPIQPAPIQPAPTLPGIRSLVINGHGYGHGRGLGQWGAYGYAVEKGWNYRRILEHFYGNTRAGNLGPQSSLSVRLLAHDNKTLSVYQSQGNLWLGVNGQVTGPRPGDAQPGVSVTTLLPVAPVTTTAAISGPVAVGTLPVISVVPVDGSQPTPASTDGIPPETAVIPPPAVGWSALPAGAAVIRIQLSGTGRFVISESPSCAGPWTVRSTVSASSVAVSTGPIVAANPDDPSAMLQVCQSNGSRRAYRGEIVAVDGKPNQYAANRVLMEDYLRGVLPAEVPSSWGSKPNGAEVLKAQAVAARSYAIAERRTGFASTCDTVACQVYLGRGEVKANGTFVSYEDSRADQAIVATALEVRVDSQGSPVRTEFSSSTGGQTAGGAFPAVRDEGDASPANPHANWTVNLTAARLEAGRNLGAFRDVVVTLRDGIGPYGGRVQNLVLKFERGDVPLKSGEFLRAYNLRSVLFDIKVLDSNSALAQSVQGTPPIETIPLDGTSGGGVGLASAPIVSTPGPIPTDITVVSATVVTKAAPQAKVAKTTKKKTAVSTPKKASTTSNPTVPAAAGTRVKGVSVNKKPKTSLDSGPPTTTPPSTKKK
jgi:SpoIID/LytB domain protein